MPDYYIEMKQKEKSAYVDFRTDVETSRNRHIQLVEKDERLISFNYQNTNQFYKICNGDLNQ